MHQILKIADRGNSKYFKKWKQSQVQLNDLEAAMVLKSATQTDTSTKKSLIIMC